jgi:hypothetical protein
MVLVVSRVVLSTIISPYLSYYVYQRSSWVETRGYKPFCCLAFGLAAEHQSPLAGRGVGIHFQPTSALHLHERSDPLLWVDRPTLFFYFIVPTYLPTLELV